MLLFNFNEQDKSCSAEMSMKNVKLLRTFFLLQIKAAIAEAHGDLEAMEQAAAAENVDVDDDSELMRPPKPKPKRKQDKIDTALEMLQCRLKESSQIMQNLATASADPGVNPKRSFFTSYVKDTLQNFSDRKYKKAKSVITKQIMNLEDDDTEDDENPTAGLDREDKTDSPQTSQSVSSFGSVPVSTSQCGFQPLPHTWRQPPPGQVSPWQSQSVEYMQVYNQQPYVRQPFPPAVHDQPAQWSIVANPSSMANPVTMITSSPTTTAQMTSSSLSGVVGSASQVVNQW